MAKNRDTRAEQWGAPLQGPGVPSSPPPLTAEDRHLQALIGPFGHAVAALYPFTAEDVQVGQPPLVVGYRRDVHWVSLGGRRVAPEFFGAQVDDPEHPDMPTALMSLAIESGRLVCNQITFLRGHGQPSIQTRSLRAAFDRVRRRALALAAAEVVEALPNGRLKLRRNEETFEAALVGYDHVRREAGRGVRLSDDLLRQVAEIYLAAEGDGPAKAVQIQMFAPRATASRWIREARRRGFLPPSGAGKE